MDPGFPGNRVLSYVTAVMRPRNPRKKKGKRKYAGAKKGKKQ